MDTMRHILNLYPSYLILTVSIVVPLSVQYMPHLLLTLLLPRTPTPIFDFTPE